MANFTQKCLVTDNVSEFNSVVNSTKTSEDFNKEVNFIELGTLIGVAIIAFSDVISIKYNGSGKYILKSNLIKAFNGKLISKALTLTLLILLLPLIITCLLLASLYKVYCCVLIQRHEIYFAEFLDSFDVFWSLEDDATKSVINVLGVIESDSPYSIADSIKEKLQNIIPHETTRKIFYRKNERYGFYFWEWHNSVDINEYVDIVEYSNKGVLDTEDLENFVTEIQNQDLPYSNEGLFKIFITKQKIENQSDVDEYGIVFKIHHSVGDGVALIEFLCQTLADKTNSPANMFSFPEQTRRDSPYNILDMMAKLCKMPLCFVDGIIRNSDNNSLHKPALSGKKIFKWSQSDENLLLMIKEIKDSVDNMHFSDVLAVALAGGLRNYFIKTKTAVPEDVAVVLPVRFPKKSKSENDQFLRNDFSVTILDLPVRERRNNVTRIKKRCDDLRRSADPLTNYYFLKLVSSVLPKQVLQPLLNSSQATMVFSNMPGPDTITISGGNKLKSLVFFVPQKGSTGLGITALCYGGVLRLAAMADSAVVSKPEDLSIILTGMVDEIMEIVNVKPIDYLHSLL